MAKNATREMTSGSPLKLILSFAVPLLLGMLFQQFYSMVDTIIVGKSLGVDQLAGVGSTGAINFMIIGFCNGVCSGLAQRTTRDCENLSQTQPGCPSHSQLL